jgi:serine/threonine-protein phosphatase 2A activator
MLELLDELDAWIDDIPPYGDKQRFGNLAFRDWGARLSKVCSHAHKLNAKISNIYEQRAPYLLEKMLPGTFTPAIPLLVPYLLEAFGNFTRLDYGSGHELCFALFLMSLTLIRFFEPEPAEERQLVLVVFLRYLRVVWRLQDVYRLEPAGSHGVWGIDDYHFLGFLWGSSQLRGRSMRASRREALADR